MGHLDLVQSSKGKNSSLISMLIVCYAGMFQVLWASTLTLAKRYDLENIMIMTTSLSILPVNSSFAYLVPWPIVGCFKAKQL